MVSGSPESGLTPEESAELESLEKEIGGTSFLGRVIDPAKKAARAAFEALPPEERNQKERRIEELQRKAGGSIWDVLRAKKDKERE